MFIELSQWYIQLLAWHWSNIKLVLQIITADGDWSAVCCLQIHFLRSANRAAQSGSGRRHAACAKVTNEWPLSAVEWNYPALKNATAARPQQPRRLCMRWMRKWIMCFSVRQCESRAGNLFFGSWNPLFSYESSLLAWDICVRAAVWIIPMIALD